MFDGKAFGLEIVEKVRNYVDRQLAPILSRLDAIEEGGLRYSGVHQRAQTYRRGEAVTHAGNLYIAIRQVAEGEAPGQSDSWQLAVKAGCDGKDAN